MSEKRATGFATRLRAARERAGLSQGQVAKLLGIQRPTVTEMEAGRRKVGPDELARLAEFYNVSVSWLVNDKPEVADPMVELAARELAKLKKDDLGTVLDLLKTLRKRGSGAQ